MEGQPLSSWSQQAVPALLSREGSLFLFLLLTVRRVGRGVGAALVVFQGQVTVGVSVSIWEVRKREMTAGLPASVRLPPPPAEDRPLALLTARTFHPHHAAGLDLPETGHLDPPGQEALGWGSMWTPP